MPAYKYPVKNGKYKWYCNFYYTDWTGEKKHKCKRGFSTKREADEWEAFFKSTSKNKATVSFEAVVKNYMESAFNRLKPTTMETKRIIIEKKILPFFKDIPICDIDAYMVMKWQNELISYRDEQGEPYEKTYLNTMHGQLSAIFNYAVKYYKLPINPCSIAGSIGKRTADEMNIWTVEEFEKAMKYESNRMYYTAFHTLFYSGIRVGELLALTPEDILPDKVIRINKNYAVVKGVAYILEPKTEKGKRKVDIPDFLYQMIQQEINRKYLEGEDRIFNCSKGMLLRRLKKVAESAELPPIRIHDLRHSHVSMLINIGCPVKEIAERLGHESIQTTLNTYAHIYPNKGKELAEKLENLHK